MNISTISVSRKQVWDQCQQQYKYKYHLKVDPFEPEPFYFVYGKIVHKIAETFILKKGSDSLAELTKKVLQGEIPIDEGHGDTVYAPKDIPNEYKKKLDEHIASIQKLTDQIGTDGIVEWEFEYDLDPPHNKIVRGYIDRLIQKDDKFFIIDYKTSKKNRFRKNRSNVTDDLQLRTYAMIVQRHYNVPAKNIKAALYYLEGANLIGASFSDETLEQTHEELLEVYDQIKNTPPEKAWGNVGDWCNRCDYRKICPFYRIV